MSIYPALPPHFGHQHQPGHCEIVLTDVRVPMLARAELTKDPLVTF